MPINYVCCIVAVVFNALLSAQETLQNFPGSAYHFTITHRIPSLPVQDQGQTGTCWSFAGISFAESEIMRISGAPAPKLSEMFLVRAVYFQIHPKAHYNIADDPNYRGFQEEIKYNTDGVKTK